MSSIIHPLATAARWHRPLFASAMLTLAIGLGSAVAMLVDHRLLLADPLWLKPTKFGFAFTLFGLTLAWLLTRLRRGRRLGWWLGTVFAVAAVVDVGAVAYGASQGLFSHFSGATDPATRIVQGLLTIGVAPPLLIALILAVVLLVQRGGDRALTCALRTGLALAAAGMISAIVLAGMSSDVPRAVTDANGNPVELTGSHGIGDPDGSGMLLTGWSLTGGDLRVPHFAGLHALQVLLAAVLIVSLLGRRVPALRDERVRTRLVRVASFGYAGLFAVVFWQAARGQSFAHPDSLTAAVTAVVIAASAAAGGAVIAGAFRAARATRPAPAGV